MGTLIRICVSFSEMKRQLHIHSMHLYKLTRPAPYFDLFKALYNRDSKRYTALLGSNAHYQLQALTDNIKKSDDYKQLVDAARTHPVFYTEIRTALHRGLGISVAHTLLAEQVRQQSLGRYALDELPEHIPDADDLVLTPSYDGLLDQFVTKYTPKPLPKVDTRGCDDN